MIDNFNVVIIYLKILHPFMNPREEEDKHYKSVVYKLYPNSSQERIMVETLGYCGSLYNTVLDDEIENFLKTGKKRSVFDLKKRITRFCNDSPEMKRNVYSTCRRNVATRIHRAMKGCHIDLKTGELMHKPRFKSENRYDSFCYEEPKGFGFEGKKLHLSRIGDITYRNEHHPAGVMRTCTVKRDARGDWYAVIVYEVEIIGSGEYDLENNDRIGYDLGLVDLITDSYGNKVKVPDFHKEREKEIAKVQRKMQGYEKGSPGWEKWRRRLAIIHLDAQRKRNGFLNRLVDDIVHSAPVIVFEDLEPKKMKERPDHGPATRKRYTEASWGMLMRKLRFKAAEAGTTLILVDPRNTSRTCSMCGNVRSELPLSMRTYHCECCGMVMDRDWNAAINILYRGLNTQTLRSAVNGQPV